MSSYFMLIAVLLPIVGGCLIPLLPLNKRSWLAIYTEFIVITTSVLVFLIIVNRPDSGFVVFDLTKELSITLKLDETGSVFATLVAFLWPFATLYAVEYMRHETHEKTFFGFYTMTYGVTLGIAMAGNIVTLYLFYEMLTIVTLPLVMHTLTKEAIKASRTYIYYSLGGAAFAFIGMVYILKYGSTADFVAGGVLDMAKIGDGTDLMLLVYVICFCGFSVKAAMFPFSAWLPKAGVAPTPVTALLHAVAVVKAGAFAIIRVTNFSFGTETLKGTWAQNFLMVLVIFTIVYGCSRGLKEPHFKRRLAWSTVSNLSYILFGVITMSPMGLLGAFAHMICHALMKITAFFCAGSVIYKTGRNYVYELDGFGRKMPKTFFAFTISGLALMGVPGLCGFVSKWDLAKGAVTNNTVLSFVGVAALLVSSLLTAIYMLSVVVRAYFPGKDFDYSTISDVKDPNWMMTLPLILFVVVMFVIGLNPFLLMSQLSEVVDTVF